MSSSSNINYCVTLCNQRGTVDANGKRVSFFNFPKDPNLQAQWLQKIQRDVGTKFKLTEITNVCSLHFRESEIKNGLGGRKMRVDVHHQSSFEICMAHFTAKETAIVCKIFTEEEQASSGRIIQGRIIHGMQRQNIRSGQYSFSRNSWNRKYWITRFMRVITIPV